MLFIVSNRLPMTATEKKGKIDFKPSVGGLTTGMSAYLESLTPDSPHKDYLWMGWPGLSVEDSAQVQMQSELQERFNAYPVFIPQAQMDRFYNGFCNKTIWPLFHYFTTTAIYEESLWKQYKAVNELFCDALMKVIKPGSTVWVHDYHLMLLPKMIRERVPDASIGFFLHIPFPSYEVFRLLPRKWGREILEGLLGANQIGFHTSDYTQYFTRCVLRTFGYESKMGQVITEDGSKVHIDTFPMGIDFDKFYDASTSPKTEKEKEKLQKPDKIKMIISVDRLDYTKGILHRIQGYAKFLEMYPEWHKRVIMLIVVVPSRVEVDQYAHMKKQIDQMVGSINGRFGTLDWTPAVYQNKSLSFNALVALYNMSDVALITPLRDGMNLIAKEYVASHSDQKGVLVLSDMAGAAKEMSEAVMINPNSPEEIAEALKEALEMPEAEQVKRNTIMQDRLKRYNVTRWANDFMRQLNEVSQESDQSNSKLVSEQIQNQLVSRFQSSKKRLFFLDYDGTLVPFEDHPSKASPTDRVVEVLQKLSKDPRNEVVIISGRDRETLESWLGELPIQMVAEHGVFIKDKSRKWQYSKNFSDHWKPEVMPMLNMYADRTPGAFIEEKGATLVWHYRKVDPELGSAKAKELIDDLTQFTANIDVQVLQGHKVVEIRNTGVDKGASARRFLSESEYDFILAMGDDVTDEDLFRALPETAHTIKIGVSNSEAELNLKNQSEVLPMLELLEHSS